MAYSSPVWPRKSRPNGTGTLLGVIVLTWVCFTGHSNAASHCFGCEATTMDCDLDLMVCRSRCEKKVACDSQDGYCMVATYRDANFNGSAAGGGGGNVVQLLADLRCYPSGLLMASDVTPHYCGVVTGGGDSSAYYGDYSNGVESAGGDDGYATSTCMCTHDYCNDAIYLEGAEVPTLPKVEPGPDGTPDSPITTSQKTPAKSAPSTPNDLGDSDGDGTGSLTKSHVIALAVSLPVGLVLVAIFVLVAVRLFLNRNLQKLQDRNIKSPTESTSLDLTTEDSDVKVIGQDTPPESPVHLRGNCLSISLSAVIGRGRFGEVWRADLKYGNGHADMAVAVKVFHEIDSGSWSVEKEMFTDESVMLKHENVVEFIAAEVRQGSYDSQRQFWLVTRYYAKGCLYHYLQHRTVSWQELCRLAGTTARGVAHLHADVYGPHGLHKIPLAHRDLKSSNVLVKDDGTCAIADFGLSIQLDPTMSIDQLANSGQAGTPRYMAPEALESKVNLHDVESFKQMDVYSLSLIVWEIAKRCSVADVVTAEPEHVLPFYDSAPGRATIDDMKTVVALQRERPGIPPSWRENTGMQLVAATMEDSWDNDPEARLTAHCVEARFTELITWIEGEQNPGHNDINTITVV